MNIRNFVFLTALCSSMVLTAAPGDILRAKIRYGKDYPMLKKAMKPEDLNVLAREDGTVTFFGDKKNLRISVVLKDQDIISESTCDQDMQTRYGDSLRFFIKPSSNTMLWEVQVAANGKKSCFFHWGAGRMFYPLPTVAAPLKVQVNTGRIAGGWKCEVVFPLELAAKSRKLPADTRWQVMVSRCNFGSNLPSRCESSYPQATVTAVDMQRFGELPY